MFSLQNYPSISTTISNVNAVVVEVFLWFVFITCATFVTYFIVSTFIFISNNRQYRHLLSKPDADKTEEERIRTHDLSNAVKASETRLLLLGAIIGVFGIAYLFLSSYLYLNDTIRENMWQAIYYCVGILGIGIVWYGIRYIVKLMKYMGLPEGDLERLRLSRQIEIIKKKLKILLIIVMTLVILYFALVITIANSTVTITSP
jgi:hypothetical protein